MVRTSVARVNAVQEYIEYNRAKVAVYIRFSTADQAKGWTEEFQKEICEGILKRKGWTVEPNMIFIDRGISGFYMDTRLELQRMLELVQAGEITKVVAWKLDRIFRNTSHAMNTIKDEWRGKCHLVTSDIEYEPDTEMGLMMLSFGAAFAEIERMKIRDRTMEGRRKNAEHGINPGTPVPYGYTSENGIYEIDPVTGEVVEYIFKSALNTGLGRIAKNLNAQGIAGPNTGKVRKGKVCEGWTPQTIRYLLNNTFYLGVMTFGKMNTVHKHMDNIPAIVSQELFDAVQKAISGRNVNKTGINGRTLNSPYLLTGIAYCKCGSRLKAESYLSHGKRMYYYRCTDARTKGHTVCDCISVPMEEADQIVLEHLNKDLLDKVNRQRVLDMMFSDKLQQIGIKQNSINELKKSVNDTQVAIDRLDDDYMNRHNKPEDDRLTTGDYNRMMKKYTDKLTFLENQQRTTEAELDIMVQSQEDTTRMEQNIEEYSHFDKLPVERQKAVLRKLLVNVTIKADKGRNREYAIERRYPKPE